MDRLFDPLYFFSADYKEFLFLLQECFPSGLHRLQRAYSVQDTTAASDTPSPSQILYGANYDEVNRTIVSVLALRWIYNGDYEAFVAGQPEPVRLTRESFHWVRTRLAAALADPTTLTTFVTAVVINDLGKDATLATDYYSRTGEAISSFNHDAILWKAAQESMVPALERLEGRQRTEILRGLQLGAEFDYGQPAQAENAPACLASLRRFGGSDRRAIELHFLEQLLDVAGAASHVD